MRYIWWWLVAGLVIGTLAMQAVGSVHAKPAKRTAPPWPSDKVVRSCMVYIPAIKDLKLRRVCEELSPRMP